MNLSKSFLFLLILFFSCQSKNTKSFISLKDAYFNWYEKNHITDGYSFRYSYFKLYNKKLIQDYRDDLSRFDLELSQINLSNLGKDNKIDFLLIKENIQNNLQLNESFQKITSEHYLRNISYSIYLLLDKKNIPDYEKFSILKLHLDDIILYLNKYEEIVYLSGDFINDNINSLVDLFSDLPFLFNAEFDSDLNIKIEKIVKSLRKFEEWNTEGDFVKEIGGVLNSKNFNNFVQNLFSNDIYDYNSILKVIESNINSFQNIIFDESLTLYLLENDEPVWVDKDDSLNVVKWVIDNKINVNNFNPDVALEKISIEYNYISDLLSKLNLKEYNNSLPSINSYLFSNHSSPTVQIIGDQAYFNLTDIEYLNKYYLNNMIFDHAISNYNVYKSFYECKNPLRSIKNNPYNAGFTSFLKHFLYTNHFNNDSLYKINFYLNLLRDYSMVFNQNLLANNKNSKDVVINNLQIQNFISKKESINLYKLLNSDKYYIEDFIVYLHLLNLYDKNCVLSNRLKAEEFIDRILEQGYIPYYLNN